ncbi:protein-export membrane protein SecD [Candidatus Falkowbacteria bacterium RIFCSPLOWO2_12_FULL_45_10]|uniref:Protein translocase subunit SecD n=2 Tax=Candidatus Falkowiibacteriota TaxID=1752728 RepID=A0A1F5RP70_9BACT|nr:MAG: protein-export membrane protein SecD [Candidatus Falkowbacteria bacterium RIFCSPHIGHO2_02_FULL_45_15]OGF19948.1 MAG: protein-export membrane protein SecD [Candidatus Falkowbacteria bacterium RIFCSPLOWO2_12_FULL_45_10]
MFLCFNDFMFKSEKQKTRAIVAGIVILTLAAALIDFGSRYNRYFGDVLPRMKEIPFRLGLDLLGGTRLMYEADVSQVPGSEQAQALEGVREVIERRVNIFGVSEPVVQTAIAGENYRLIVELAGIKDINQAITMIGETPLLEFKEQNEAARVLTDAQQKAMDKFNQEAEKKAKTVLAKALAGEDFTSLAKQYNEDEITKDKNGDLGWIKNADGAYFSIYERAQTVAVGKVAPQLVNEDKGFNVIKVEDKRAQKEEGGLGLDKKEAEASHLLICYAGAERCDGKLSKDQARQKISELKVKATPANFGQLAADNSTEPGADGSQGKLGWFSKEAMVKEFADAIFTQAVGTISDIVETKFGFHLIYKTGERSLYEYKVSRIFINQQTAEDILGPEDPWKNTQLSGKYLQRSAVEFNPNDNSPEVRLSFNSEGKDLFADITKRNVGKPVAIFLDGVPISIPTVNEAITSGDAVITGRFTIKEAKLLAQRLNAGALPVPIKLVSQNTVGASLGKTSVEASLRAGLWGILLVALFMIIIYRLPGLLSVLALGFYGLAILAVFKIWPVTLTLAGVAGFILSIGMAVDANVLIFSRLAEELRAGKPWLIALNESFRRAWPSIRDGNATTLLVCLILIQFGTSIIKGFAVTLTIGILVSMFSALVVTKYLMKLIISEKLAQKRWLFGVKSKLL